MLDLQLMFQASKLQSPAYWLVRSPSSGIPQHRTVRWTQPADDEIDPGFRTVRCSASRHQTRAGRSIRS